MTTQWSVPAWAAVVTIGILVVLLVLAVLLALRARAVGRRQEAAAEQANAELRARVDELDKRVASTAGDRGAPVPTEPEFVITSLGTATDEVRQAPVPALPARAFADAVLRDAVVNTAALAHGVRRALSPEVRNRIRFEMKREVKRNRKERKVEVREALREYRARHRAEPPREDVA